jgi:hypothetical protein
MNSIETLSLHEIEETRRRPSAPPAIVSDFYEGGFLVRGIAHRQEGPAPISWAHNASLV